MKARDERRVSTLRMVNAAIKNADLEAQGQGKARARRELPRSPVPEDDQAAPGIGRDLRQGRPHELADQERAEIEIIRAPAEQMSDAEAGGDRRVIQEISAETMKDMGRVMAALSSASPARWTSARLLDW